MTQPLSIEQVPLFKALSDSQMDILNNSMRLKRLKDGKILFKEDDVGSRFYVVLSGQLEVLKALGTAEERLLGVMEPGDFVGEISLLVREGRRSATVRSRGESLLMELTQQRFDEMVKHSPTLAYHILCEISERMKSSDDAIIKDLKVKNQELAQAYEDLKAAQAELIEMEKMEHEMNMARGIQMSMLPRDIPSLPNCEIGAKMVPARAVGGDFYDIIPLGDNKVGLAIGDVSDKGVPAAMFMAQFCTLLRVEAQRNQNPEDTLLAINRHLLDLNEAGLFVTAIYGIYDYTANTLTYARAGHEVPVIFSPDGTITQPGHQKGAALCIFPDPPIDVKRLEVPSGATLLMYTDGGTDAMNADEDFFGLENLQKTVSSHINTPIQELCDKVMEELLAYQKEDAQFDDATLVMIRAG